MLVAYFFEKQPYRNLKRIAISFSVISSLIVAFLLCAYFVFLPVILKSTAARVKSLATSSINNAVFYALTEKTDYDDLIDIFSDDSGKINMIRANSVNINKLARETSRLSQESINKIGDTGLDLTLGSLTQSPFIIGQGIPIHIKLMPIGTVNANFYSEFESVGINQTRHKIFIEVVAEVEIVLPFVADSIVSSTEVLVCENILIGDVPKTYFTNNGERYNLLPN
ncbi:MAG: sporulation protein YunB [Clostridia bacterium]